MTARGICEVSGELLALVSERLCFSSPRPYLTRPYNRLKIVERTTVSAVTATAMTARKMLAHKTRAYLACNPMGGAGGIVLEVS